MSSIETQTRVPSREAAAPRPAWQILLIRPETMTLLLLILAIFVGSQLSEFFLDINYILRSFTLSAEFSIVALVLTMLIIAGEIDLSPAANMALSACLFAYAQQAGIPIPIAIAIGLVAGLIMGLFNALMIIGLKLPSIIVTIGTIAAIIAIFSFFRNRESIPQPLAVTVPTLAATASLLKMSSRLRSLSLNAW